MRTTYLKTARLALLTSGSALLLTAVLHAQTMTDIGATAPTPGTNDISQLSTNGNVNNPTDGLNYYTDNGYNKGAFAAQSFLTGTNGGGYSLNSVFIKTGGQGSDGNSYTNPQTYTLAIYKLSGTGLTNASIVANYAVYSSYTNDGDWIRWNGFNPAISLAPNTTYAYGFGRTPSSAGSTGYDSLSVASGNLYSGGQIALITDAGGKVTYGTAGTFDATFDIGLTPLLDTNGAPGIATQPLPDQIYAGQTASFTVVATNTPFSYQWQSNGVNITDGGRVTGAQSSTLTISGVTNSDAGSFTVIISNGSGSVTSSGATLTVLPDPAAGTYAAAVLSNSPIAFYQLDESSGTTAYDNVGGHDGIYNGATPGQPGESNPPFKGFPVGDLSAGFNGASSYVTAPFGTLAPYGPNLTMTAWIYPIGAQSAWAGVLKDTTGGGGAINYNGSGMIGYTWNNNNGDTYNFVTGLVPPTNQWSLIAVAISPTNAVIYMYNTNSQTSATNSIPQLPGDTGNNWEIGNDDCCAGRFFNGMIDDVAIFPSTLSFNQLLTLYGAAGIDLPPSVETAPSSHAVYASAAATLTFTATVSGTPPLSYQWQQNGVNLTDGGNISGSKTLTLTVSNASAANAGSYTLIVSNAVGSATSAAGTLTIPPVPAASSYPGAIMADNPIAYYRLNESNGLTAFDYAEAHDGTYENGAAPGQPGVPNPPFLGFPTTELSVGLDSAASTYVLAPFSHLGVSNVTFTCWIYPVGAQSAWTGIIMSRDNAAAGADTGSQQPGGIGFNGSQMLTYTWNSGNADTYNFVSGLVPPDSQWSMYTVTISPTQAVLYLYNANGLQAATNAIPHTPDSFGIGWQIGDDACCAGRFFNGMIDEVAVFTNTLSGQQVFNLWAAASVAGSLPPQIDLQPDSDNLYVGETATFSAGVLGSLPLTYHWQKNGVNLSDGGRVSGSATPTLTITGVAASDDASYSLIIANSAGSVTTSNAVLTVVSLPPANGLIGAVLADNPIAFYPLNETSGTIAYDYVGGYDGTYESAAVLGQGPGQNPPFIGFPSNNVAVQVSGTTADSWVLAPFGTLAQTATSTVPNITISAWIYPQGGAQNANCGIVFDRGGGVGGLDITGSGNLGYTWNNNNGNTYGFNSGLFIPSNQWSLAAMTITPTQAVLFLYNTNGQFAATNAIPHSESPLDGEWHIGNDASSDPGRSFNGLISDVAIFTNALTPLQIIGIYGAGVVAGVLPPTIEVQPVPSEIVAGRTAHFSVLASGGGTLNYQWTLNGTKVSNSGGVSGATNATLVISNAQSANAGTYAVTVSIISGTNSGSITSSNVTLTLVNDGTVPYVLAVSNLNPVAYWRFSEAAGAPYAFDAFGGYTATYGSGILNGGANAPGPQPPSYTGFEGNNSSFDAFNATADSYVTAPPLNLDTNDMSIVAWIWSSAQEAANTGVIVSDALNTYAGIEFEGSDKLGFIWNGATYAPDLNVTEAAWTLVALTIQSNQAGLYAYNPYNTFLNSGSQDVSISGGTFAPQGFNGVTEFGNDPNYTAGVATFNGFIDEVAIFNYALTPTEVANLYTAGSGAIVAPQIAAQTGPGATQLGDTVTYTVTAAGTGPLTYQWQFNGANVAGASGSSLVLSNATTNVIGTYSVNVSNGAGTISSTPIVLSAVGPPPNCAYEKLVISMNPITYYRLDETNGTSAYDYIGGFTGTWEPDAIMDEPGPSPASGFAGFQAGNPAAGVDDQGETVSDSYVLAPFGNLGIPNVSFALWIYPIGAQNAWSGLFVSRDNGPAGADTGSQVQGGVGYNGSQMVGYTWNANNADTYNFATGLVPPTNEWSLVVVTIQPTAGTVYLYNAQGQASATNVIAHTPDAFGTGWEIGNDDCCGAGRTFLGYIDEVSVFSYTLDLAQVNTLYQTAVTGSGTVSTGPKLTITESGKNVLISWAPAGGHLYESPVLGPNANWQIISTNNPSTIAITSTNEFFQVGP